MLEWIAGVLKVQVSELVAPKRSPEDLQPGLAVPGAPDYYSRTLTGAWHALSSITAGKDLDKLTTKGSQLEWAIQLEVSGNVISGWCNCRTDGYEHLQYLLTGTVNGGGFVMIDGVRGVADGAEDFFRALSH